MSSFDPRVVLIEGWLRDAAAAASSPTKRAEAVGGAVRLVIDAMLGGINETSAGVLLGSSMAVAMQAGWSKERFVAAVRKFWPDVRNKVREHHVSEAARIAAEALAAAKREARNR